MRPASQNKQSTKKVQPINSIGFEIRNGIAMLDVPDSIEALRLTCQGRRIEVTNLEGEPKVSVVDATGIPAFRL
jgi:hypothetical protein